jgi:hypothetical protein
MGRLSDGKKDEAVILSELISISAIAEMFWIVFPNPSHLQNSFKFFLCSVNNPVDTSIGTHLSLLTIYTHGLGTDRTL